MNILTSGMGGGLDIVNASLLYFAAKSQGDLAVLGSIRPFIWDRITSCRPFASQGMFVNPKTKISYEGRICEPQISQCIEDRVALLCTKWKRETHDMLGLTLAMQALRRDGVTPQFYVDGGGDSLILSSDDASNDSEDTDPYAGGDARTLQALQEVSDAYHAIISVGLDIKEDAFHRNIERINAKDGYFGRVNIATGEKENYRLEHILSFNNNPNSWLTPYFNLCERILVLNEDDTKDPTKVKSHTAVVTYHALKGHFNAQRTYVKWEPTLADGSRGVIVKPEHQWMYFVDPHAVENVKNELRDSHAKEAK